MIIYKDKMSDSDPQDELLTDTYKIESYMNIMYRVEAKMVEEKTEVSDAMFGGNASAEGCDDEGAENAVAKGINIVLAHRLVETTMKKKDYKTHIGAYMKKIKEKLQEEHPDQVDDFMKNAQSFVKEVLGQFDEYQFFIGESMNPEGMTMLCKWEGEKPVFFYFKHGLEEEKV